MGTIKKNIFQYLLVRLKEGKKTNETYRLRKFQYLLVRLKGTLNIIFHLRKNGISIPLGTIKRLFYVRI